MMKIKKLRRRRRRRRSLGFTLIELLIVMVIIGILATLALVGVAGAQKTARDSKRKSDLHQYNLALESYAINNGGKYPGYLGNAIEVSSLYSTYLTGEMSGEVVDPINTGTACNTTPAVKSYRYCYFDNATVAGATTTTEYVLFGEIEGGGFWVVCQSGKTGKVTTRPTAGTCPTSL